MTRDEETCRCGECPTYETERDRLAAELAAVTRVDAAKVTP